NIGVLGAEEFFRAIAREVLNNVSKLATPVVSFPRITFGVLVRKHGAHSLENGFADKVLRGNQLKPFVLTAYFVADRGSDLRINLVERAVHRIIFHGSNPSIVLLNVL